MRFPGFEGEWKTKKLGLFIDIISGIPLQSEDIQVDESGIRILRGINITEGFIRHNKEIDRYYPKPITDKFQKFILEENDLVLGMDGSKVGKNVALISNLDVGSILIQRVAKIKALENADINFIFQKIYSERFQRYVDVVNTSSGIPHISLQQIKDFESNFPATLPEQKKVANFLSLLDQRIQTQNKIIEQLKTLILCFRNQIFSQKIRFKNENGTDFSEWNEVKIGEILKIGSGKDYKHLQPGNIPVFGTGGVMTLVDDYIYDGETVCVGRKGTIDKPMYHNGKIWTVDTLFYTHSFQSCIPKFIFHLFRTINWLEYNEASGVPSLSKTTIEKIKVQIPSLEEQHVISRFLSAIDKKIQIEKTILEQLEKQKKYLLKEMFI